MNYDFIRPDLIFTYWIYVWFIVYVIAAKLTGGDTTKPSIVPNPAFALLVGILENVFTIGYMMYVGASRIGWFILAVVITKIIPFWIVFEPNRLFSRTPMVDTVVLFGAYTVYLLVLGTNPLDVYRQILRSFEQDRIRTPFYFIMNQFERLQLHKNILTER